MSGYGILVDVTRCTGCEKCVDACVAIHEEDRRKAEADRYTARDGLSSHRLSSILRVSNDRYARKSCMHCIEPNCAAACLVGALTKDKKTGAILYDADKCIGCRYCMLACPFHIPRYEWDKTLPYVKKCDMCFERLGRGEKPACVAACKYNTLTFGPREDLLRMAGERIAAPGARYIRRIWGESEFGGTSVLYISDVGLSALGWPAPRTESASRVALPVIKATPIVGATVMTGLLGLHWIIRRRMKLMEGSPEEGKAVPDGSTPRDNGPSTKKDLQ